MPRNPNTTASGSSFSQDIIDAVWKKVKNAVGFNLFKKDACGALINKSDYGDTSIRYGWEIDHIKPVSKGGSDELSNLQPLQWENNRHKSDNWPNWTCKRPGQII